MAKPKFPEMVEFMEAAMNRVGVRTIPELAQKVGMTTARDERYLYKWWRGEHRARIDNILPLMRATGMLSPELSTGVGAAASDGDPLRALAETVGALVTLNQAYGERLSAVESALREVPAPARARGRNRRRAEGP